MNILRSAAALLRRRPRKHEPWRAGDRAVIAACDRETGRQLVPASGQGAVVTVANEVSVAAKADGSHREHWFWADGGWDMDSDVSPWRLLRDPGSWR
jgi:hypothetical protein